MILILKRDTTRPALLAGLSSLHRQEPMDSGADFADRDGLVGLTSPVGGTA